MSYWLMIIMATRPSKVFYHSRQKMHKPALHKKYRDNKANYWNRSKISDSNCNGWPRYCNRFVYHMHTCVHFLCYIQFWCCNSGVERYFLSKTKGSWEWHLFRNMECNLALIRSYFIIILHCLQFSWNNWRKTCIWKAHYSWNCCC